MGIGGVRSAGRAARARNPAAGTGPGDGLYRAAGAGIHRSYAGKDGLPLMQKLIGEPPGRIPPVDELVNVFEFEDMAQRKLDSLTFAATAGSERGPFERITFRPRMMIDSMKLDMSLDLLGQRLFAPLIVGPV